MLLQAAWMIVTSAAILALCAAAFYSLCYLTLSVVRLFPMIGKRHRHPRWDELNVRRAVARSAKAGPDPTR